MNLIDIITNDAAQKFIMVTDKNENIYVQMVYYPLQQGWFINLEYDPKNFFVYGLRITANENMLSEWKNILPFGIRIISENNEEPYFLDSFSGGQSKFYLLSESEI